MKEAETRWPLSIRDRYREKDPAGFWLVGDHGVYLMHNGQATEGPSQTVVYAAECNPGEMDFDDWWQAKRASFGPDDGVEFIEQELVRRAIDEGTALEITFSGDEMTISIPQNDHPSTSPSP